MFTRMDRFLILAVILCTPSTDAFAPPPVLLGRNVRVQSKQFIPREILSTRFLLREETSEEIGTDENEVQDLKLPNIFTKHERPQDINTESFGPLLPIAKAVDDATGGWGLSYADLHPATPRTR
jgi:hypothetical protein